MNWREVFALHCDVPQLLNEGIADEKEGKAYWNKMHNRLDDAGMQAESERAGNAADQEQGHKELLEEIKRQW
jgi:hypothetical protein